MDGTMDVLLAELLDSLVLGGHSGYGTSLKESSGDDGGGGIGTAPIVIVVVLAFVSVGLLVSLSPSTAKARLRRVAPLALLTAMMAAPLLLWAATSGGDEKSLIVERATTPAGTPEFIVSLAEDDLNTLDTTKGKRTVRVECVDREGQVVLEAEKRWPFPSERGYDYPHRHQRASAEQLRRVDRCRLKGTSVRLEADVEGSLTG
jgi:hypothetical protein